MNKIIVIFLLLSSTSSSQKDKDHHITREGEVAFFSNTSVQTVEAVNNQVFSVLDACTGNIVIDLLVNTFVFKKELIQKHFNETYLESDLYPNARFIGRIIDFNASQESPQAKIMEGGLTIKETTVPIRVKVLITKTTTSYRIVGEAEVKMNDFKIAIPSVFDTYISKMIQMTFHFEYTKYDY